jgi:hypothetical protein
MDTTSFSSIADAIAATISAYKEHHDTNNESMAILKAKEFVARTKGVPQNVLNAVDREGTFERYCYDQNDYVDKLCGYAREAMKPGEETISKAEYE